MNSKSIDRSTWIRYSIFYGLFMFIMMGVLFPLAKHEKLTWEHLAISLVIWMAAGFLVGWITVRSNASRSQKSK